MFCQADLGPKCLQRLMFCWAWSGSKLFVKVIRWQTRRERVKQYLMVNHGWISESFVAFLFVGFTRVPLVVLFCSSIPVVFWLKTQGSPKYLNMLFLLSPHFFASLWVLSVIYLLPVMIKGWVRRPQSEQNIYSRLSLSRIPRDSLKYFEISVVRHIRFAELRKK